MSAQDAAELIRAFASLAWPAVAAAALFLFRDEISALLRRITKGRAGPIEFEIQSDLAELGARTSAAAESLPPKGSPDEETSETDTNVVQQVLSEASSSPKLALITLSAELERKARQVLASSQDPSEWRNRPLSHTLNRLELSPQVHAAYQEFRVVRNKIVHGHAASDNDALRAIDYGLVILDALNKIPHAIHRVLTSPVECFANAEGTASVDYFAVLLKSESTADSEAHEHAFPTRQENYQPGQALSWEWGDRSYGETWYRDPRDNEIKYGWTTSLEFRGRPLDDV
jgi:hypothetical protein